MLLEVLGFLLLCALALCFLSEMSHNLAFGIIAGVVLLLAGLWLMADTAGLQILDGTTQNITVNIVNNTNITPMGIPLGVKDAYGGLFL